MSGTAFGTIVLHITPESAVGGPLALVQNGDMISLDVARRSIELQVDDAELARRRAALKPAAAPEQARRGYAWRMSELHAAVGAVHLSHLDEFVAVRERVARRYTAGLANVRGLAPLDPPPGLRSSYYKYPVLLDERIERAALKSLVKQRFAVALSGEVYETPLHQQPVFAQFSASNGGWTVAGTQPYLVAKQDPYDIATYDPYINAKKTITVASLAKAFGLPKLTKLVITRDGHGTWGGRVLTVSAYNGTTHVDKDGAFLQGALGLGTTWIQLTPTV